MLYYPTMVLLLPLLHVAADVLDQSPLPVEVVVNHSPNVAAFLLKAMAPVMQAGSRASKKPKHV
jgi:hypothetical protein